jgi:large subunit ribosomal protein L10
MPISQTRKNEIVQELREKFTDSAAILVTDHTGLKVKDVTVLRKRFREASLDYRIVKNTLARLAVKDTGKEELEEFFSGPNSLLFLGENVVEGTKILTDFIREHEVPVIKIGLVEDRLYSRKELAAIANLPSRDVLLAQVASGFISPLNSFAYILSEMVGRFVRVIDGLRAAKETSAE